MRWSRVFVLGFAVSAMSCLAPTEIILVLSTDVACNVVAANGVAIALGTPGDDNSGIATKTTMCAGDGGIGTAVLLPHSSIDQELGIRVTLGVDASADQCPPPNFPGCIVARRSLRFDPHTPLTLPIDLDQACIGVPCTPNSTCVSGACVDAGVECDGSSCGVADEGGVVDAGATCQPITDVTVQPNAGVAAPRVALSSDGWAVAYQTAVSGIDLADVHLADGTVSQPIAIVASNIATSLGPLGSDGASYALSYTTTTQQSYVTIVDPNGTPLLGLVSFTGYQPGHFGMLTVAPTLYGTPFIGPPTNNPFFGVYGYSPSSSSSNNANITTSNLTEITLAKGASDFYATTADQTNVCALYKCAYQPPTKTFGCTPLSGPPGPCMGMRVAEGLGKLSQVVLSKTAQLTIDGTFPVSALVLRTEFQLVATSDRFHVVFVTSSGGLAIASYDGVNPPGPTAQLATQGKVVGVDVVADGPNSPGFAIVYAVTDSQNVTSVHLMHLCL